MNRFLTDTDVAEIIKIVTKNGKGVRSSKPKIDPSNPNTGRAAYVHRHVMFYIGGGSWSCIPTTDIFNFNDEDWKTYQSNRREFPAELDKIVDTILESIPVHERKGLLRWKKALGFNSCGGR